MFSNLAAVVSCFDKGPLVKPGILEIPPEFWGSNYINGASFQDQQNVHHQQVQVYRSVT